MNWAFSIGGDRSEIGIFQDKPLENDYALNTVDICPVGALTSKDFRFQQRVWYLKTAGQCVSRVFHRLQYLYGLQ